MCHKCTIVFTNRSELPSQVSLILLQWLLSLVKTLGGPSNLPAITVAYDNICNIEKMRIARKPLPLPPPYNKLWMNVQKIIDVFHFPNHISRVHFSLGKVTPTLIHNVEKRLLHGLVDISA